MKKKLKKELKNAALRAAIVVAGLTANGKTADAATQSSEYSPNPTEYTTDRPSSASEQAAYPVQNQDYYEPEYGTHEWAIANGYIRDNRLSQGLNRIGNNDGTHGGYAGAYYNRNDPNQILFIPNDPIHDKVETTTRALANAMKKQKTNMYGNGGYEHNPNKYEDARPRTTVGKVVRTAETVFDILNALKGGRGR